MSEYEQRRVTYYDFESDDYYVNDAAYSGNRFFSCNFFISDSITTTTRSYKTYWHVLSQLGGLLGLLTALGSVIFKPIAKKF